MYSKLGGKRRKEPTPPDRDEGTGYEPMSFRRATEQINRNGVIRCMKNSAAHTKTAATVTYLPLKDRKFTTVNYEPIRFPWTEELERRRRAVARWRGDDTGLKETMTRD